MSENFLGQFSCSGGVRPVNPTTTGELPAPELAQLSEEDLLQIIGGCAGKVPKKCDMT